MSKKFLGFAVAALLLSAASTTFANVITVQSLFATVREPSAAESGAASQPVPAGHRIYQWFVTTDSDILALENVQITGPAAAPGALFQHSFGDAGNANPPPAGLDVAFPSITADSYMDTPGNTSRLGADLPGDGITTFGDLDANGPQTNFKFAQLTIPSTAAPGSVLNLIISINSTDNPGTPFSVPFALQFVPEPTSFGMAGIGMLALAAFRRRFAG